MRRTCRSAIAVVCCSLSLLVVTGCGTRKADCPFGQPQSTWEGFTGFEIVGEDGVVCVTSSDREDTLRIAHREPGGESALVQRYSAWASEGGRRVATEADTPLVNDRSTGRRGQLLYVIADGHLLELSIVDRLGDDTQVNLYVRDCTDELYPADFAEVVATGAERARQVQAALSTDASDCDTRRNIGDFVRWPESTLDMVAAGQPNSYALYRLPAIRRLIDDRWVVVHRQGDRRDAALTGTDSFARGSATGVLFLVDMETGALDCRAPYYVWSSDSVTVTGTAQELRYRDTQQSAVSRDLEMQREMRIRDRCRALFGSTGTPASEVE